MRGERAYLQRLLQVAVHLVYLSAVNVFWPAALDVPDAKRLVNCALGIDLQMGRGGGKGGSQDVEGAHAKMQAYVVGCHQRLCRNFCY